MIDRSSKLSSALRLAAVLFALGACVDGPNPATQLQNAVEATPEQALEGKRADAAQVNAERLGGAPLFAGTHILLSELPNALKLAEMSALRPVGSTSTVFRAQLSSGFRGALKAATHKRPLGPVAEVAAYVLASSLGFDNVPPAVLRRVSADELRQKLDPEYARQWRSIMTQLLQARDGTVEVAAIYWIEGLTDLPLGTPSVRAELARSLRLSEPMPDAGLLPMAASLSSLQAFDFLIGNWDRWSGGNVKGDASGRILYMRDHDAAFAGHLNATLLRRMLAPVLACERFSRGFFERLRALKRQELERALANAALDSDHPLLDQRSLAQLFDRRAALLSHISALIDEHGAERVLAFP